MPGVVRHEPDRQRDERVGGDPRTRDALELGGHRGGEPEHAQERRPLREHDVLEQVHQQRPMERERVERRDLDGEEERAPAGEAGDPPARRREPGGGDRVGDGESCRNDKGIGIP